MDPCMIAQMGNLVVKLGKVLHFVLLNFKIGNVLRALHARKKRKRKLTFTTAKITVNVVVVNGKRYVSVKVSNRVHSILFDGSAASKITGHFVTW